MNQILVTQKLYITPELKRKKKIYKFHFFLSIFLVCILVSLGIYAEYDKNKAEEMSQEILAQFNERQEEMNNTIQDTTIAKNNILIVVLDDVEESTNSEEIFEEMEIATSKVELQTTKEGYKYTTIARIEIPKINVNYPILDGETDSVEETDALLKMSPTKFWGPNPNEVGNFCIVGHNYRNKRFFSKVPTLLNGDLIQITDSEGKMLKYSVYDKYEVIPEDLSCTTQLTNGEKEITLITCTDDSKKRVIVKAREI